MFIFGISKTQSYGFLHNMKVVCVPLWRITSTNMLFWFISDVELNINYFKTLKHICTIP